MFQLKEEIEILLSSIGFNAEQAKDISSVLFYDICDKSFAELLTPEKKTEYDAAVEGADSNTLNTIMGSVDKTLLTGTISKYILVVIEDFFKQMAESMPPQDLQEVKEKLQRIKNSGLLSKIATKTSAEDVLKSLGNS